MEQLLHNTYIQWCIQLYACTCSTIISGMLLYNVLETLSFNINTIICKGDVKSRKLSVFRELMQLGKTVYMEELQSYTKMCLLTALKYNWGCENYVYVLKDLGLKMPFSNQYFRLIKILNCYHVPIYLLT